MNYSAENTELWFSVIQFGIIAAVILISNIIRKKVGFIRKAYVPTAVITGFLLLILKVIGVFELNADFLEALTYHGIAIGFIALSLRIPKAGGEPNEKFTASKSGALIVSTYLVQAITGLLISVGLAYTFCPELFSASGILLPMGYGQGPGQANNVGLSYEAMGFTGGQSFGLALAASGYLCACVVGVIYINYIAKKGLVKKREHTEMSGSVSVDVFQDNGEIPINESIDKFSIQAALVLLVYLITYGITVLITGLFETAAPGVAATVSPLLWGFNFIIGSMVALITGKILSFCGKRKYMNHQYQNNYLLSRISGFAFDIMIAAGIASINIADLSGLWLPFILMAVAGGVVTFIYLIIVCRRLYPNYYYEGFVSMYGMLTGTISSGILLLRELDSTLETPAANNLVTGSSFGILLGAPILIVVGIAPKGIVPLLISLACIVVYLALLLLFMYKAKAKNK